MIILGIDAGIALMGYGVIKTSETSDEIEVLDYGVIQTEAGIELQYRLTDLAEGLTELIEKYRPDVMAIEKLFFFKNQKTFVDVLQARGVTIYVCANAGLRIYEYTPLQIKQALTGYGKASKAQIQEMVKVQLKLSQIPKPDDAADALAICLTQVASVR